MSVINALRYGVGWASQRSTVVRDAIKAAKARRLVSLSRRANAEFVKQHPDLPMPPLRLMADAQAHTEYRTYYVVGRKQAEFLASSFKRHLDFGASPVRIFEWGCGPGRLVRHMTDACRPHRIELRGSDYNPESVEWCRKSFPQIQFFQNGIAPPLELADNSMDVAYCVSVFTHLSDELCRQWIAELARIVRPGGLIAFTIAGLKFTERYNKSELADFKRGIPIYHSWDEAGRRDYFAWHPPQYIRRVFLAQLEELEHVTSEESGLRQDFWLARVPASQLYSQTQSG